MTDTTPDPTPGPGDVVRHVTFNANNVPARDDRDWVTGHELCNEAGITYRQCDYWTRTDLLIPVEEATPGSGHLRRYPEDQVTRASVLADLLDAGVSLPICREVIDQLVDEHTVTVGHITFTHHPAGGDAA